MLIGEPWSSTARDNLAATALLANRSSADRAYAVGLFAGYSAAVAAVKTVTVRRVTLPSNRGAVVTAGTLLSRGSTDRAVATASFEYIDTGVVQSAKAAVSDGTALAAGTIPQDTWGGYLLNLKLSDASLVITAAAANFTTGYADEASAIAAFPTAASGYIAVGMLTVQTKTGSSFVGGTDGLHGGSSGNVANATNYYPALTFTQLCAALPWNFALGAWTGPLPAILHGLAGEALTFELQASGSGGVTGTIVAFGRLAQ